MILLGACVTASVGHRTALAQAPEPLVLRADAGLGGYTRAGRWTPVRLSISNHDRDISGEVVVEWGDVRLHRAVSIPAPAATTIELYVRTLDVRSSMTVRLIADAQTLAAVDVPVRVVSNDEALVVCVGTETAETIVRCTTRMAPEALPTSMRGYVAADDVRLQSGAESRLASEQRAALRRWRAYHEREVRGVAMQAPKAPLGASSAAGVARSMTLAGGIVIATFLGGAWMWSRSNGGAWRSYVALLGGSALGVVAAGSVGRFGPGSELVMHHATTVEQIGDQSVISLRATIEYPAFDVYTIRAADVEGDLTRRPDVTLEYWLDAEGAPVRHGTFGRGMREQLEFEGVSGFAPFRVTEDGGVIRVVNTSGAALTSCSFPAGFSERNTGALAPGQSTSATMLSPVEAPYFSCVLERSPMRFTESRYPVRMRGVTVVSVTLPSGLHDESGAL